MIFFECYTFVVWCLCQSRSALWGIIPFSCLTDRPAFPQKHLWLKVFSFSVYAWLTLHNRLENVFHSLWQASTCHGGRLVSVGYQMFLTRSETQNIDFLEAVYLHFFCSMSFLIPAPLLCLIASVLLSCKFPNELVVCNFIVSWSVLWSGSQEKWSLFLIPCDIRKLICNF